MARIRLGIIFGGRSSEHEVSLRSARSVVEALDRRKYDPVLIGIDLEGRWHLCSESEFERLTGTAAPGRLIGGADEVALAPSPKHGELLPLDRGREAIPHLDVIFPVLHGQYGEDGTMQGLLELAEMPYVGCGVLGSALGMDKDVQKKLLHLAGLPVVEYVAFHARDWRQHRDTIRRRAAELPYPLFVKPANLGSSVGITKVRAEAELDAAIDAALEYDTKVLVERGVDAREIECAVLGNETPEASVPGEICPTEEFYSYEAKYVDEHGATFPFRRRCRRTWPIGSGDGGGGVRGHRVQRHGARRLLPRARQRSDLRQRAEHHPGLHLDQSCIRSCGRHRVSPTAADRPPGRARARTASAPPPAAHRARLTGAESPPRLRGAHAARK